jgi:3-oxoacyl-[acyl-carrier-protein] synthase II
VVGAGLKAPGGTTVDELWAALRAGRSVAEPYEDERLPADARLVVSRVGGFDPADYLSGVELRRLDRAHQLAMGAAQDALDCLGGRLPPRERCAVVCGVGLGAASTFEEQHERVLRRGLRAMSPLTVPMGMPSATASLLALRFGLAGPCLTVSTACASGATAIGEGVELLRRGACDLVLAGGVDALLSYGALCGFLRLDVMSRRTDDPASASRPFDAERDGFVMGEGAGFLVLQRPADARGREALGAIVGHGATADAHHLVAPPEDGEGALRCMRLALSDAGAEPAAVGHVNAHGTSTVRNDLAEARALAALFDGAAPPVTAVKGTTGHLVGGSGAVEAIVTLRSLRERLVPPVAGLRRVDPRVEVDVVRDEPRPIGGGLGLSNAFGFGGANACLVLAGAEALSGASAARAARRSPRR